MVTDGRDDIPEDTTVTGGVVVIAVEVDLGHYELQERYKMKHNGHPMDVLTETKNLTCAEASPQSCNIWDVPPIAHAITHRT